MVSCRAMAQCLAAWLSFSSRLEHKLNTGLGAIGAASARRPLTCLGICTLFSLACMCGFARVQVVTDAADLWTDQNSRAKDNQNRARDKFPGFPQEVTFLITAKSKEANTLTKPVFGEAFELLEEVRSITTPSGQRFDDLCWRTPTGQCVGQGVMRFFFSNRSFFEAAVSSDADVVDRVSSPTFPDSGERVIRDDLFAKYQVSGTKMVSAPVLKMNFLTETNEWELAVLEHFVDPEYHVITREWNHIIPTLFCSGTSINEELGRNVRGDIGFFAMAYVFLVASCTFMLGHPLRCIQGRRVLGQSDFFLVLLATGAGYGLSSLFGVPFTQLQQVLPFILTGIGVDDAFVIVSAFDRTDKNKTTEERVRDALMTSGLSVTLTSVTDILAFLAGSFAVFPAVKFFCIYAGISVLIIYLFHITAFCAMLALDDRRQRDSRMDILCCFKCPQKEQVSSEVEDSFAERVMAKYAQALVRHLPVKLAVLGVFLGFTGVCLWQAITKADTTFEVIDLAPDTSHLRDFLEVQEEYWEVGLSGLSVPVFLHFPDVDLGDPKKQAEVLKTEADILKLSYIDKDLGVDSWLRAFLQWARTSKGDVLYSGILDNTSYVQLNGEGYLSGQAFFDAVQLWVGNCTLGCRFGRHVFFKGSSIEESRVIARYVKLKKSQVMLDALAELESFCDTRQDSLPGVYVTSPTHIFLDSYGIIYQELAITTSACLAAVIVVGIVLLAHPLAVLIVFFSLVFVFIDLLGCVTIAGVRLNSISMINMVMAIGLVVDYSMHIVHSFLLQSPSLSRNERSIAAMKALGTPVFKGVFSTFVSILPLAFASSEVFRIFFKMFMCIVLIGGAHGLIFMPVLLALCGPSMMRTTVQP